MVSWGLMWDFISTDPDSVEDVQVQVLEFIRVHLDSHDTKTFHESSETYSKV